MLHIQKSQKEKMRYAMVQNQIAARGVENSYVLEAMRVVPRDAFIPDDVSEYSYEDLPVPIGYGQTLSQPYIVGLMAELADLHPTDIVLEIGTGSGYGAAILGQIAKEVYTIERHQALASRARNTLEEFGYTNIEVTHGDGSEGLPEEAPFDAIVVTAGGPQVPDTLKEQLAIGGSLVMPVGESEQEQHLMRIRRLGDDKYVTEDFGAVKFVPLIGKYGWSERITMRKESEVAPTFLQESNKERRTLRLLEQDSEPLPSPDSPHFGQFFDRLADARVVLLGESTHGTAEFYRARAAITLHLVRNHGFNIVALEADWPDAAIMDAYIRGRPVPDIRQPAFGRFPEWMWRNREFAQLVDWLKKHNGGISDMNDKAGIYGLDVYSLRASVHAVIDLLDKKDPELAAIARTRYACFEPWLADPINYGRAVVTQKFKGCEQEAVNMLMDLMEENTKGSDAFSAEDFLDLTRNAETIANAEKYYRVMFMGSAASWNLRDRHMFNTLRAILKSRGPYSKAIVWAHNSHVGDARATDMGKVRGELNIGQLCRENFGDQARLVGFGTASGQVAAASYWGGPVEIKTLKAPLKGSYESLWDASRLKSALLDIREGLNPELEDALEEERLERAVGVIYRPETERISHYFTARPAKQFDHYIWFQETNAVKALPSPMAEAEDDSAAETFPFGV